MFFFFCYHDSSIAVGLQEEKRANNREAKDQKNALRRKVDGKTDR